MIDFSNIETEYLRRGSTSEIGDRFERMCCWFLLRHYDGKFSEVWRWQDLDWGPDIGIDIVARCTNGDWWAVQAKAVNPHRRVSKREIDSFLSASSYGYARRVLVATTELLGRHARTTIHQQRITVDVLLRSSLDKVDWSGWSPEVMSPCGDQPQKPDWIARPSNLTVEQVLRWVDSHKKRFGQWPQQASGSIREAPGENWNALDAALRQGHRGLPGGASLARLIAQNRGAVNTKARPQLEIEKILDWADKHYRRNGQWPTASAGAVQDGYPHDTWKKVDGALRKGTRGLPGGSSLAQLLHEKRQIRHPARPPVLDVEHVLTWADQYQTRHGTWPVRNSGDIEGASGETWNAIDLCLQRGTRGLPGGSSLARLLEEQRGKVNKRTLPPITEEQIEIWARAHYRRTGKWPKSGSGKIAEAPGETWRRIGSALEGGYRGLSGGVSLAKFLAKRCNARNHMGLPPYTLEQISDWAGAFHDQTGRWPTAGAGPIHECPGETWAKVNKAFQLKLRGLPCDAPRSLAEFLRVEHNRRNPRKVPRLNEKRILRWAKDHQRRTGTWPTRTSGQVISMQDETWAAVDTALCKGKRGLRGGSSISRLLASQCGVRNRRALPALSVDQIVRWAMQHLHATGAWPTLRSGTVQAPGGGHEKWRSIDNALRKGLRGLPGGGSLHRLQAKYGDSPSILD